jgi:hypothetical protein
MKRLLGLIDMLDLGRALLVDRTMNAKLEVKRPAWCERRSARRRHD